MKEERGNRRGNGNRSGNQRKSSRRGKSVQNSGGRVIQMAGHRKSEKAQVVEKNKFSVKMQKKLVILYVLVLLAFIGLIVRLTWITRENGTKYQKQVL